MKRLTTQTGLQLLSSAATTSPVIFDYLVFSETKPTVEISKITLSTLASPKQIAINRVDAVDNGFLSTSVLDSNVNDSYSAQAVGLVGHTAASTTPQLISVSVADDVPIFVVSPEQASTTTITYLVEYSNTSANVTSNLDNAKTATIDDVKYAVNLALGGANFQAKIASGLAVKADKSYVDSNVSNLNASNTALQSEISSNSSLLQQKADKSYVDSNVSIMQSSISSNSVGIASNGSQILSKANSADLTALQNVVNTTIARQQSTISSLQSKLSSAVQPISILSYGIGTINAYQIGNRYYLVGTVSWTAGNGTFNLSYLSSYGISGVSNIYNAPSSISLVGSVIQGDNSGGPATFNGAYLA